MRASRVLVFTAVSLIARLDPVCAASDGSPAPAPALARSEVSIREVDLSNGERRYGVPIKIGNAAIEAGLDTGSTGLRVLPGVLGDDDAKSSGDSDHYSYGSGTKFEGEIGTGTLTIGQSSAPATMQLIKTVGCRDNKADCPADKIPSTQFGIQGDGLPGEGFRAILGVNMAEAEVDNPLSAIGAARWIVELPRPNSDAPGKIILNPSDDDMKGFVLLPLISALRDYKGGLHDSVPGCIINATTKDKACGALTMDTGAAGIVVYNSELGHEPWANGTAAMLGFFREDRLAAVEQFTVGSRNHASHLAFASRSERTVAIYTGLSPYFAFDVLYDPGNRLVGLRPRPAASGTPEGTLIESENSQ